MAFTHLLSPMKVGNKVYKNRIVSAPMAFSLVAQNPMAAEVSYRKLEGPQKEARPVLFLVRQMSTSVTQCVSQASNHLILQNRKKIWRHSKQ